MPQVAVHERKRKPNASASSTLTNAAEISEQQSVVDVAAHSEESKRKKLNGPRTLDMNMNICDENGRQYVDDIIPAFVWIHLHVLFYSNF